MTTVIAKTIYKGGIEAKLKGFGEFMEIIGVIFVLASFISLVAVITIVSNNEYVATLLMIFIGLALSAVTFFMFGSLLKAAADNIRLLKKLNGLNYSGEISAAQGTDYYRCSECGNQIESADKECQYCKKGSEG